jgi:hypothetical protein
MSLLKDSTCKISVQIEENIIVRKGTGFFVSKNRILTCNHVIAKNDDEIIFIDNCKNQNGQKLTAKVIEACPQTDYALLEIQEIFENEYFLELCDSEIIEEEEIKIFGYPEEGQGQDTGEILTGVILSVLKGHQTIQDVSLRIDGYNVNTGYGGFSGSPVINNYGQVTSIIKYEAARSLSSVSIKKAKSFLERNGISINPDQIISFNLFKNGVFAGFADRENECEVESNRPINLLSPKLIIEKNKDELFYPKKNLELKDLISYLRKNKDLNDRLWKGWIQLLTYVEILKGDYSEANSISIKITSKEFYKQFGLFNRTKDINVDLYLNFYLTEEKDYFKIAQKSIHENRKNQIVRHTCNIFNSNIEHFGNTNKLVVDISNPEYSGPSIPSIKIGALSLLQINRAVIDSDSLADVSNNLKKIFEDAINKS